MTITQEQIKRLKTAGAVGKMREDLDAAIETLEKLPVTADGVRVVPGMELWENVPFGGCAKCPPVGMTVRRVDINAWGGGHDGRYVDTVDKCYSTREAAEAAKENEHDMDHG